MGSGTLADFLIFTSYAQYSIQWIDTALFKRMEFVYLNDVSPSIIQLRIEDETSFDSSYQEVVFIAETEHMHVVNILVFSKHW